MATANKTKAAGPATRGLRVTTKRDGFRRAGIEWNGTTTVPLSELSADQAEAIKAETTMLIVDEVDIEPKAKA
jgi:hypothetical protein